MILGCGSGGGLDSFSEEDIERLKREVGQLEARRGAEAALDCFFRFFREWLSTTSPDADAFVSVSKEGNAVGANQAAWNIDWMHDMKQWSEGVEFHGKPTPKWDDVRYPHAYTLADAAALFKAMSVEDINARLAPVATVQEDLGEAGCEGGRRLHISLA